jgi:mannose-6-phosphate isomerase
MKNLYPLKFKPILKDKIWGGDKIGKVLKKNTGNLPNCGESWEISGVPEEISVVTNGFLKGNNLEELVEIYMGDLVGDKIYEKFGTEFPLLIKFIDAKDKLSIQVHPNDKLAEERHKAYGKTEMWYVIQAEEGSQLITGFKKPISKEEYLKYFNSGRLEEVLNYEKVKAGDSFFIPAGLVHAIGQGILLAEIQQTSDVTYRIFDFNRKDEKGHTRELHTELALDAIDFKLGADSRVNYEEKENISTNLVECQYFTTNVLPLRGPVDRDFAEKDTFVIYMCLDGSYKLTWEEGEMDVQKGETILIPAVINNFTLSSLSDSTARLLEVYVNGKEAAEG